jgi:hypothetical protein
MSVSNDSGDSGHKERIGLIFISNYSKEGCLLESMLKATTAKKKV